ncbi:MAG: peptidoglycan DD-metalloendopeptidase family protein [Defluviitaleaceae bacterium]|nr:peptidoglycan DD-metalloendopeptidase family protein [Defluviitaleaceae bacterium]
MKKKSMVLIILAVILSLISVLTVGATQQTREQLREIEAQRDAVRRELSENQNLLAGTEHEMSELVAEMQVLDQRFMDAAERLESIEMSLVMTESRREETYHALALAHEERDLQYEVFRARLRAMYMQGPTGWLEVLFDATSISDFFARMEIVQTVAQFDRDMITRIEDAEEQIIANADALFREENMLHDLRFLEEATQVELQAALEEREVWLYALSEDAERLAAVIAVLDYDRRLLDDQYGIYRARYQNEAAALAAQRSREAHNANLERLNNFNGQFAWPIPTHSRISSPFGMRRHPILGVNRMHQGIDVGAPTGTRLVAAADGYVRFAGWSSGFGLTVIIDHGNGYSTLYAHNSVNRVVTGQAVTRGQHIADVGSTGMSTGPHIHFEIRRNNVPVDPMQYFR